MWNNTSALLEIFMEKTWNHYVVRTYCKEIRSHSYGYRVEDRTAPISYGPADPSRDTRLTISSEQQNGNGYILELQVEIFQKWKTSPQDCLHHLCSQSLSGMKPLMAKPRQCSAPHRLDLAWTGHL